ncbi:MAG: hemerythrin domain-containing protein [Parcubacteria group bacterium]|nr:hemerythrin domain-containing protein [Parcubacteria group bacterium]
MSKATEMLTNEHKNILLAIAGLFNQCAKDEQSGAISHDFYQSEIDFIRNYADKFHHAKEEDILFVELNKDSANPHCNPTEQMLYEHDLGRQYVKELATGLEINNLAGVLAGARGYGNLLKDHIYKEDNILYPMADEALSQEIKDKLLEKFERIAREYSEANQKYELFLSNLNK